MQSQCVQYVIAGHILILITDHIEVTSPGSFKMWTIFNWWAHCDYFVSVNTMSSQCTCWVFDPLSPVHARWYRRRHVGQILCSLRVVIHEDRDIGRARCNPSETVRNIFLRVNKHFFGMNPE